MKSKYILYLVIAAAAVAAVVLATRQSNVDHEQAPTSSTVVCTMDAKLCPDGSYVGRVGPKCEFAPCPTSRPAPRPSVMY